MTAASADLEQVHQRYGEKLSYLCGAVKHYQGTIVNIVTSTGYTAVGADTSGHIFAGVAAEQVDNSAGSAGDLSIEVWTRGTFTFACASADQTWVGSKVYAVDDQTVALVGTTSNDILVGRVVEFISATEVRVLIDATA